MNTSHISKLSLLKAEAQNAPTGPSDKPQINTQGMMIDETMGSLEDLPGPENEFGSLIPIKLDLEIEGKRLKEVFLWDKQEPYLSIESFVKILMEEHNLS